MRKGCRIAKLILLLFLFSWRCHIAQAQGAKAHHHMSVDELRKIFQVEHHDDVPDYEIVQIHSVRHSKRSADSEVDDDHIHRVNLQTHGRKLRLELRPNRHLVPPNRDLDLWYADAFPTNVSYSPVVKDSEHIGDVYQDEVNQAALLLYRDKTDDALLMDGTIGDDLVVKPISADVRRRIRAATSPEIFRSKPFAEDYLQYEDNYDLDSEAVEVDATISVKRHTNETDDYAFLDEDENLEDDDIMVPNFNALVGLGSNPPPPPGSTLGSSSSSRPPLRPRYNRRPSSRRSRRQKRDIRTDFHVVFKRKDSHLDHVSDYNIMEMDRFPIKSAFKQGEGEFEDVFESISQQENFGGKFKRPRRKKRQAPYLIFPEILCIIDYDGYRLHGKDNVAIKRYVISFWNGIDLRYKLLKDPGVKISIAGIIISRGRDATPYLERNRVGRDAIDSASALTDMGKYLFLERRLPVYDIAVAITKLDMCRRQSRYGECNRGTAGFAYVGGACVVNKRLEKVNSVAIVEDTGGFSGIIVAAHELGHLLGAVHDGSPPPSYLGGPGARKCRWEDGFIMSDLRHTSKGFRWSHCTIKQFHHFLNGETATCMYNSPHETESLARVLPGKLLTLDAQCRKDRGTSACFKDDRVCAQLFCFDAGSGYCVSYRPAAEGSRCGDGAICLNGKCVVEHENAVDFEGHGFLRRSGLADTDDNRITNGKDTPAEPSNNRKWWQNLVVKTTTTTTTEKTTTTTEKSSWRDRLKKATTTKTTTTTTTTTPKPKTTTLRSVGGPTTTTTTERLPWWKRLQGRTRLRSFFISTTTTPSTTTTTTTTKALATTPITTPRTTPATPPKPKSKSSLSSSKSKSKSSPTSRRRSQKIKTVTKSVSKSSGTATVSENKGGGRSKGVLVEDDDSAEAEDSSSNEVCEDTITNIAGSLSCKTFLRSFAYQYCRHKYIKKNCCASHKIYCHRGRRGRRGRQRLLQQVPSSKVATTSRERRRRY